MKLLEVVVVSLLAAIVMTASYSLAVLGFARGSTGYRVLGVGALMLFALVVVAGVDVLLSK